MIGLTLRVLKGNLIESVALVITTENGEISMMNVIVAPQLGYFISTIGLSTYTSEHRLAQAVSYQRGMLWKLRTVNEDNGIPIKYPTEMELSPIRGSNDHLGIKPAENMRVRHQTFLQVSYL